MLPRAYELPAALLLLFGGALACFAGYRLFRVVLAIYGFILGASMASSVMGVSSAGGMIAAAVLGGLAGALIFMFAYFVGIALVGAGLGASLAVAISSYRGTGDPPAVLVVALAIAGAMGAMLLQRYVIVVATAFGGAWTMVVGAFALAGDRLAVRPARSPDVWVLYPLTPAPGQRYVAVAWVVLGLIGTAVQLGVTARRK